MRKWFVMVLVVVWAAGSLHAKGKVSFEDGENWRSHVRTDSAVLEIVGEHAVDGTKSAKILFRGSAKATWPGVFVILSPEE